MTESNATLLRLVKDMEELKQWKSKQETQTAIHAERYTNIKEKLDTINSHLTKLVWLIIGTVIAGLLKFVINV